MTDDRTAIDDVRDELAITVLRTEKVALTKVHPHPRNARRGDVPLLAASLKRNGQYRPIVANRRDGSILAGNHTYMAAQSLGWERLLVSWVDVDDEQALRILLVDNRSTDQADYDNEALQALLRDLPTSGADGFRDLDGTGFDKAALDRLDADVARAAAAADNAGSGGGEDPPAKEDYRCPDCGHEWSGAARPQTGSDADADAVPDPT